MAKIRYPSKIIPPVYQTVFDRTRLLDILTEYKHRPLVWVHGSPGAGKTTLISSWLQQQKAPFLWYRMDKGINVCADLFYFLSLSAERNYPHKQFKLPVFTAEYADDIKVFAVVFFRQLFAALKNEAAIVLDNCQEIESDPEFFQVLQIALDNIPEGLQIVCLSRNQPAPFLSRLSLAGDMLQLNPALLRFTDAESSEFLAWLNPDVDKKTSTLLQSKAKGWAIALVLLSQKNPNNIQEQMPAAYEQQQVFGFLMTEILANLDKEALQFLAETAIFNQFTVSMATALTGYQNAQRFLDNLVDKNLLIDRTDEINPIYCYHPIFRDLLNNKNTTSLSHKQFNDLNQRAITILLALNKIDEALPFYLQLQDWSGLKTVLITHAKSLIDNGRHHAVIRWVESLPNDVLACDAWLQFWYAVAIKPLSPNRSAELLDQCYQQFYTTEDLEGLYLTWQVAVESITYSMDDFSQLSVWFKRFDELQAFFPDCPSLELKVKFSVTALQSMAFYNPQHPSLKKLLKISEDGLSGISTKLEQQLICSKLAHYYILTYEVAKLEVLEPYLLDNINDETLAPISRIFNGKLIAHLNLFRGNGPSGVMFYKRGKTISEQFSIELFDSFIELNLAGCYICCGDLVSAQDCLDKTAVDISCNYHLLNSLFHFNTGWLYAIQGQLTLALEHNEHAIHHCQDMKNDHGQVSCLGLKARLLAEMGRWDKAENVLLILSKKHQQLPNKFHLLQYYLSDAWLGLLLNNQNRALIGVTKFLSMASHEQLKFFYGWQPNVMTALCVLAIEHDIEVDYALSLIQVNALCQPPSYLEQWPWPVRIYCFNQFKIELNGKPFRQDGKSQKKLIELLWVIITLGCQNVRSEQICDCLWPDSEGDLAQQALNTAIFRLRKLIGKSVVVVKDGNISLNPDYCWIDILAFEATLNELNSELPFEPENILRLKLINRLFHLYQGAFLKDIDSSIVKVKQKQLQNKLIHQIKHLIAYFERQSDHKQISVFLEQNLDRVLQFEDDYQELQSIPLKL